MKMLFPEPFPEDILEEIRDYPGNEKCCDCASLDSDWASVSHGILICLDCAGKHRSLGVQVSFVRSITMDTWSKQQVEMMRQGGNGQIRRFFKKLEIEQTTIQGLYCSKAAEHYRDKLKERVEAIMSGEIKSEKRVLKKKTSPGSLATFLGEERRSLGGVNSSSSGSYAVEKVYQVGFLEGPMGMTLTKNHREHAAVSRLVTDGQAETAGVIVGDVVVGVGGLAMQQYDDIMARISQLPRPLTLDFAHLVKKTSPKKPASPRSPPASQPHTSSAPVTPARPSPASSSTPSSGNTAAITESSNLDTAVLPAPFTMSLTRGETFIQSRSVETSPFDKTVHSSFSELSVQHTSGEYSVTFSGAPLGLTLSSNRRRQAEVIRIKAGGNAETSGVKVGDILSQVDRHRVELYEEAMKVLPGCVYPLTLTFRRETTRSAVLTSSSSSSALHTMATPQHPSKNRAARSLLEDDSQPSILDLPTPIRFANPSSSSSNGDSNVFFPPSQPALLTSKSFQDSATADFLIAHSVDAARPADSAASSFPPSNSPTPAMMAAMNSKEFDIVLHHEGDVGFELREPSELSPSPSSQPSIVVNVREYSAAQQQGLKTGCVVTGINKEKFLSHAHTVATLKHGKRPIVVRFRAEHESQQVK